MDTMIVHIDIQALKRFNIPGESLKFRIPYSGGYLLSAKDSMDVESLLVVQGGSRVYYIPKTVCRILA